MTKISVQVLFQWNALTALDSDLSCLSVSPNQRHRVLKLDKLTVHSQRLSSIPTGKMEVGGEGGGTALDLHPIPPPSLNSYTPQRHDQVLPVFSIR